MEQYSDYIEKNAHGSNLQYLNINSKFGTLKFLIDSGSSHSFIDPIYIPKEFRIINPNMDIISLTNRQIANETILLNAFSIFKRPDLKFEFIIYKFHKYFDGLIGLNILRNLNAVIDFKNNLISTPETQITMKTKPNYKSSQYTVLPYSHILVEIPVDHKEGTIFLNTTYFKNKSLVIQEGVYESTNWRIQAILKNLSGNTEEFVIFQPLKVKSILNNFHLIEVNTLEIQSTFTPTSISNNIRTDHMNYEEKKAILKLCDEFKEIFHTEDKKLTFSNQVKHEINTTDDFPIYTKNYRYPYIHKDEVQRQINKMLEDGIIQPSFSPWSSPIWIVPKKLDASQKPKWRLVIDYRKLNAKTISDRYPLPNISEILDKLGRCNYFSTLDLASGFHQIEINQKDISKTAFSVDSGHYEFLRMPFGLKNAPSTFQRVMDNVLRDYVGKGCLVYMDDIVIYSTSLEEHLVLLKKIFKKLKDANLKIQPDKSEFLKKETAFLGHIVSGDGIKPNPDKIHAVLNFPIPETQKDIKSFLGLVGYYRKFIKDFAKLTKPLTKCLKKNSKAKIQHTPEFIEAINICKHLLTHDPILEYPDFNKKFTLTTDASDVALGAVLSQTDKPIAYASRTLSTTETHYSTTEKELLAIVWATKYFRPYLYGQKFTLITDHKPLTWLLSLKEPNAKLIRWRLKLQEFDFDILYKEGKLNTNADALSRAIIDPNVNDSIMTQHSANEDNNDLIPISENPINDFSNQLFFYNTADKPKHKFQILFQNKKRNIFRNEEYTPNIIIDILKEHLQPNKLSAIYCPDDELFLTIQNIFEQFFSCQKIFKVLRCTKFVTDVFEEIEQDDLIKNQHDLNGHRGIEEIYAQLRRHYYFPYMRSKISQYVNLCKICMENKYDRNPPKLKFEITQNPKQPLDICHADIFYVNKTNTFFTIIDKFSKFAQAIQLQSRNTFHLKQVLTSFISQYGKPTTLVVDQEGGFSSIEFSRFCKEVDINLHITSSKSSNSNSPIERFHSTLLEILRIIEEDTRFKDYPIKDKIAQATFFYNSSIHSTTKHTPFEIFFGRKYDANLQPNLENLIEHQKKLFDKITPIMIHKKEQVIQKLNKKRNDPVNYTPNQIIYAPKDRRTKLTPKFRQTKVTANKKVIIIDHTKRKLHKNKLRRPRKTILQVPPTDNVDITNATTNN